MAKRKRDVERGRERARAGWRQALVDFDAEGKGKKKKKSEKKMGK